MYMSSEDKLMAEIKKATYKCKCGHSVVIKNKKARTICKWCGREVKPEGKSVYDMAIESRLQKQYYKFLEKKEKKQNEN